jgi:glycosyltransferase involved in cell wall biosynthesis
VLAGTGASFDERVRFVKVPEAGSRHPNVLRVQADLAAGHVTKDFSDLRAVLISAFQSVLADQNVVILHNVCTLHKNLALSAALHDLLVDRQPGMVVLGWHHDLAWTAEQYQKELHPGYPWDLLRKPWPLVQNVTVSPARRTELARIYGISETAVSVVTPGIDPREFLKWSPLTQELVGRYGLLEADILLLLPARITRRKNIEMGLRIVASLRAVTGLDARLIITGPPGPHNPTNVDYLDSLYKLGRGLALSGAVHFLYELYAQLSSTVVADIYGLCDALLFPSKEEGFGIPMLEAGLARLPVFCSDIPAFRATGEGAAHFFDLNEDPAAVAARVAEVLERDPANRLRRRILNDYTWQRIVEDKLMPLLVCRSCSRA